MVHTWKHHIVSSDFLAAYPWSETLLAPHLKGALLDWWLWIPVIKTKETSLTLCDLCYMACYQADEYTVVIKGLTWWTYSQTPLHIHQQPKVLIHGRIDLGFHVVGAKFWSHARVRVSHQTRQPFWTLLFIIFGESVWTIASFSCSYTEMAPSLILCSSASRFDVLCV